MYKELIKELILSNQFRVYTIIANHYFEQLEDLKPLIFRGWLAKDLGIDEEKLNLNSLSSALRRQRRKLNKQASIREISENNPTPPGQRRSYRFSKDDEPPQKKNIVEM